MSGRYPSFFAVLLTGLLLSTFPIVDATTFNSPIRITTNAYISAVPSVAADGSSVYVAWEDWTPVTGSGSVSEIWMRASSISGASFGSPVRVSYNAYDSMNPSVAATDGHVYVAWGDDTPVTGSGSLGYPEIWMRVSANNGASFGSPIRISTNTGQSQEPSVAASGSWVYVAWQDDTTVTGSGGYSEIWMRVSKDNGASFGSAIRISTNTYDSLNPSVAAYGSYVYVAWYDGTPVSGSGDAAEVWLRVSSNNGASFGSPIRISTNLYDSFDPSVATSGSYVYVAWMDDTPVTGSGGSYEIWMRVSANYGASFGSAIRISYNAYSSWWPSVATAGPYVYVAWQDWTPVTGSGTQSEIWMRVSSYGGSFGPAIRISYNEYYSQFVSVAATGSYLLPVHVYVAWEDSTPVTGSGDSPEIWFRASISA